MGHLMGMDDDAVYALTVAGAMHDCALSEYLEDEITENGNRVDEIDMAAHCIAGESVMKRFPFYDKVKGAVLFHHDRADGRGAMGRRTADTPVTAQLIHIADAADVQFGLDSMDTEKYRVMNAWIEQQKGTLFAHEITRVFLQAADYDTLCSITGDKVIGLIDEILPPNPVDIPISVIRDLSVFFGQITDYKSHFTWKHSIGIAEKAEMFGRYYGYPEEKCQMLYIAGALHDIGKLLISNDILEKPGKLSTEEYREIQNHAIGTWKLLHNISGMEEITRWAALHHEKLDGSGYPFGYTASDLSKEERMMACLDIYQALVEERPYKSGMSHEEAMAVLRKMGSAGQLDSEIIEDIDSCHEMHTSMNGGITRIPDEKPVVSGEAWRCPVCGYIVEGELPDGFICPRCEQPGTIFERIGENS
jgi:HD-GYP domain-containing protein (c-di-GMP phosphodiesterase class II)